jgi:hypothetical protein
MSRPQGRGDSWAAATLVDEVRHGVPEGDPDVRLLGGYFVFDSPDAGLLVGLLPPLLHLRGADRLSTLTRLVATRPANTGPGPQGAMRGISPAWAKSRRTSA